GGTDRGDAGVDVEETEQPDPRRGEQHRTGQDEDLPDDLPHGHRLPRVNARANDNAERKPTTVAISSRSKVAIESERTPTSAINPSTENISRSAATARSASVGPRSLRATAASATRARPTMATSTPIMTSPPCAASPITTSPPCP